MPARKSGKMRLRIALRQALLQERPSWHLAHRHLNRREASRLAVTASRRGFG